MSKPTFEHRCVVEDGDKLPADTGGAAGLCTAIMKAAAGLAGGLPASVEVRVLSASSLSAIVKLADGRVLPEQKMAVSDRELTRGSIERFAAAIAAEIGRASGQ